MCARCGSCRSTGRRRSRGGALPRARIEHGHSCRGRLSRSSRARHASTPRPAAAHPPCARRRAGARRRAADRPARGRPAGNVSALRRHRFSRYARPRACRRSRRHVCRRQPVGRRASQPSQRQGRLADAGERHRRHGTGDDAGGVSQLFQRSGCRDGRGKTCHNPARSVPRPLAEIGDHPTGGVARRRRREPRYCDPPSARRRIRSRRRHQRLRVPGRCIAVAGTREHRRDGRAGRCPASQRGSRDRSRRDR